MSRVQVSVDAGLCVASGTCVDLAPQLFTIGADGVSHPTAAVTVDSEALDEAEECCPVRAITIARLASDNS